MLTQRLYKVVCIDKESGEVLLTKDRMLYPGQSMRMMS